MQIGDYWEQPPDKQKAVKETAAVVAVYGLRVFRVSGEIEFKGARYFCDCDDCRGHIAPEYGYSVEDEYPARDKDHAKGKAEGEAIDVFCHEHDVDEAYSSMRWIEGPFISDVTDAPQPPDADPPAGICPTCGFVISDEPEPPADWWTCQACGYYGERIEFVENADEEPGGAE